MALPGIAAEQGKHRTNDGSGVKKDGLISHLVGRTEESANHLQRTHQNGGHVGKQGADGVTESWELGDQKEVQSEEYPDNQEVTGLGGTMTKGAVVDL